MLYGHCNFPNLIKVSPEIHKHRLLHPLFRVSIVLPFPRSLAARGPPISFASPWVSPSLNCWQVWRSSPCLVGSLPLSDAAISLSDLPRLSSGLSLALLPPGPQRSSPCLPGSPPRSKVSMFPWASCSHCCHQGSSDLVNDFWDLPLALLLPRPAISNMSA